MPITNILLNGKRLKSRTIYTTENLNFALAHWGGGIFYRKRSLEVWEDYIRHNTNYVGKVFPSIIEKSLNKNKITTSEAERLLEMIKSPDIENQMMVISILKEKLKKRGNVHR